MVIWSKSLVRAKSHNDETMFFFRHVSISFRLADTPMWRDTNIFLVLALYQCHIHDLIDFVHIFTTQQSLFIDDSLTNNWL